MVSSRQKKPGVSVLTHRVLKGLAVGFLYLSSAAGSSGSMGGVKAVVFPLQPLGVDSSTARAASLLLREHLASAEKFTVIPSDRGCYYADCAVEIGRELDAQKSVIGKLAKRGKGLLLSLSLIDVRSGRVEFSDRLESASEEGLHVVLERASVGLSEKKRFRDSVLQRDTIEETTESVTPKALTILGIRAGQLFPLGDSFDGRRGMLDLSCTIRRRTRLLMAEGGAGIANAPKTRDLYVELLVHRIVASGESAPYVGIGVGAHGVSSDLTGGRTRYGPGLNVAAGMVIFRTQDFRVIVDWRYKIILLKSDLPVQQGLSATLGLTTGG